jgi:hypothetical protein
MSKREWFFLTGIALLAGVLRMGWPGITEFKLDEARVYKLALGLVEFKSLPLSATDMSVGLPNSPLTIYLYALPMFFWKSPLAPLLFGGALNTLAVALLYGLARRYWGTRAAIFSALLYATAPWAVLYSRKIWASNLLPLFLVGYVFSGLLAFAEGRYRWVVAHLILFSVIFQIHFSSIAFTPVTLGLLLLNRRRLNWRWVGYGIAGAALLEAPFLWYLLTRIPATSGGLSPLAGRSVEFSLEVVSLVAMVVQGTYTHALAGPSAYSAFLATLPNFNPIFWIGGGLGLAGAVRLAYRGWMGWKRRVLDSSTKAGILILLWLSMPLAFFLFHLSPVYPHYLTVFFSIAYLLSGVGLDWLLRGVSQRWQQAVVIGIPLAIAGAQVWQLMALLNFVRTQNTPGAFGAPIEKLLEVAEAARRLGAGEVLVLSDGVDAWNDEVPAVFDVLLHDIAHRFLDGRTTAVFPVGRSVVILWPGDYPSTDLYRQWGGGEWSDTVPLRAGEGETHLAVGPGLTPFVPFPREASALLSNGAELLGSGGDAECWELWWRAPGPPGETYHTFAHLLDGNGARIAQADQPTYPSENWRAGDLVVSYFMLSDTGASVRAGMYAYPSLEPVLVLDVNGNPVGEWIEFPLP